MHKNVRINHSEIRNQKNQTHAQYEKATHTRAHNAKKSMENTLRLGKLLEKWRTGAVDGGRWTKMAVSLSLLAERCDD